MFKGLSLMPQPCKNKTKQKFKIYHNDMAQWYVAQWYVNVILYLMVLMYMFAIAEFIFPPTNTLKQTKYIRSSYTHRRREWGLDLILPQDSDANIGAYFYDLQEK